jgi:organic radical activating enzyme
VKESWDADKFPKADAESLAKLTIPSCARLVVITGGEPLMYNLDNLCAELKELGKVLNIETSGAYPLSGELDWICLSPKKFKAPLPEVAEKADELKVVVYNKSDFAWAEQHAEMVNDECVLYLQPEWSVAEKITPQIIDYVKAHPRWQISLQTHKYLNIP